MILIADSGSTKTEWALLKADKSVVEYKTIGLNPVFVEKKTVIDAVNSLQLNNYISNITKVYFYGAGCSTITRQNIILEALSEIFVNSSVIVETDLLGAAISQFGTNSGIIGILGTGSNTGVYDNGKIIKNISSLGYILGDEGSGAVIGKAFIKSFLDNDMPKEIKSKFATKYKLSIDDIITKVYKQPFPNRFLASFMPFLYDNKDNEFVKNMLYNSFADFIDSTICKYENYNELDFKLIGSIAHYFSSIVYEVCIYKHVNLVSISKSPLSGLVEYYSNNIE